MRGDRCLPDPYILSSDGRQLHGVTDITVITTHQHARYSNRTLPRLSTIGLSSRLLVPLTCSSSHRLGSTVAAACPATPLAPRSGGFPDAAIGINFIRLDNRIISTACTAGRGRWHLPRNQRLLSAAAATCRLAGRLDRLRRRITTVGEKLPDIRRRHVTDRFRCVRSGAVGRQARGHATGA